jgi:hypothetical protein
VHPYSLQSEHIKKQFKLIPTQRSCRIEVSAALYIIIYKEMQCAKLLASMYIFTLWWPLTLSDLFALCFDVVMLCYLQIYICSCVTEVTTHTFSHILTHFSYIFNNCEFSEFTVYIMTARCCSIRKSLIQNKFGRWRYIVNVC